MKLSRDWLSDYIDLTDLSDDDLAQRFTSIGHAVESVERHGEDTVFDLEITANRVDAMSHLGMARELVAALGRELHAHVIPSGVGGSPSSHDDRASAGGPSTSLGMTPGVTIRIDAPEMCRRYTARVIRDVTVKQSPEKVRRRLEAVGLGPINNVVDTTNYVMMAVGHPLHAFDLDRVTDATIIVRAGRAGEKIRTLDGEQRAIDPETVVIADAKNAVALGGVMGGFESEITEKTRNVLLECAWFTPSVIRRTARRLGLKTDASYRFERGTDPNDTLDAVDLAASLILELAGGTPEAPIDIIAAETKPKTLRLRSSRLSAASGGVVGDGYALGLFRRIGFDARAVDDGIEVTVPTYRGDIHEEMDLIEEVLRFFGYDKVPSSLPRVTIGDARPFVIGEVEDELRQTLVGSGLTEVINYSFIHPDHNPIFSSETPVLITNALNENIAAMRLSLIPGLLETVAFNRGYGNRDGALFEVGRTYHRHGEGLREHHRIGIVMFGTIGTHWGDPKRPVDFYDVKGIVEQIARKLHVPLAFGAADVEWLRKGKRAIAKIGDKEVANVGFVASEVLQKFGVKGDVAAAEIDLETMHAAQATEWKMSQVARYPGVPMILAITHGRDLEYQRIIDTINKLDIPYLHEVGLRDRYTPEGEEAIKTTLGMWYQAFDRSLTQEEVGAAHQQLAARVAELLPVTLLS